MILVDASAWIEWIHRTLAAVVGLGDKRLTALGPREPMVRVEDVVLVGVRDVDAEEAALIRKHGLKTFTLLGTSAMRSSTSLAK